MQEFLQIPFNTRLGWENGTEPDPGLTGPLMTLVQEAGNGDMESVSLGVC